MKSRTQTSQPDGHDPLNPDLLDTRLLDDHPLSADDLDKILAFRQRHPTAKSLSLLLCHSCGMVNPAPASDSDDHQCRRCHAPLHLRKPGSLDRTLALVIAAIILYIPANLLPMTITDSLLGSQQDTIMSGVIYFWHSGDYLVSAVIFIASIFIPMLKLLILAFLLIAVHQQGSKKWHFRPEQCAVLYRIVEFVGRWSMIDVFVVSLLAALIQMQSIATILAGPGAVAFGAVVVLTMLASLSFDPRIIWDNYDANLPPMTTEISDNEHSSH